METATKEVEDSLDPHTSEGSTSTNSSPSFLSQKAVQTRFKLCLNDPHEESRLKVKSKESVGESLSRKSRPEVGSRLEVLFEALMVHPEMAQQHKQAR